LRLAERLGKTLHELEQSIGMAELAEWMAHDELDADYRARERSEKHLTLTTGGS